MYRTTLTSSLGCSFEKSEKNQRGQASLICSSGGVPVTDWLDVRTGRGKSPVYRPRRPRASPLYCLIERYLPEFERTYDQRYAPRYGSWRPIIGQVARKFLRCGDMHFGFARVRCPDCRHEMFMAFSCRQRCLCPSCPQKRTLLAADTIAHTICHAAGHRQLVFTIPKRLRLYFRYDRSLLGELARAAWESVVKVVRDVLGRDDVVPGLIAGIQTFGELFHFHPHIHAIATGPANCCWYSKSEFL